MASRFVGVLPRVQLRALAGELTGQPYGVCRQRVCSAFAALPSTPQLAAKQRGQARARSVNMRHVHYPRTNGGHGPPGHLRRRAGSEILCWAVKADPPCRIMVCGQLHSADRRRPPVR